MRFANMDQNRNGIIERTEWDSTRQSFTIHDWNNDGVLSGDEVRVGARRPRRALDGGGLRSDRRGQLDGGELP